MKHALFPTLGKNFAGNEVIRCIHMGLLCVQKDPKKLPTTASVVLMVNTFPVPPHPAFFLNSSTTSKSLPLSTNEVSTTEVSFESYMLHLIQLVYVSVLV
ncbi:hypothetical protein LIER_15682 [Lithospermum erythrorhizon]|uniref:Non-specific serine/threonine protein kinase n=1 Tax=Lithospermum erythrorhizon TaxID=34254 RepID=A0AAV3Q703_LITER